MLKETLYITSLSCFILFTWIYVKLKKNLNHWKIRGVEGPKPHLIFGNFKECYLKKSSYAGRIRDLYLEHRESPIFGYFNMMNPILVVNDPVYIERILKTDFSCFTDRTPSTFARRHELYKNLFNLNGPRWKAMRNKMAPVFTSLKLKTITLLMERCLENTWRYIAENISVDIDLKEVASVFSHDVVVQCLFGIESKDLSRPGTRFRRMQTEFFDMTFCKVLYFIFIDQFPRVAELFNLTHFSKSTVQYFQNLVETTLNQRSAKRSDRNDLVQILLKMREKRTMDIYDWEHSKGEGQTDFSVPVETVEITDELLESQAMIFFHTGIESLVSSLVFAVYELAHQPEVLSKLRDEIDLVTQQHGLTSKALNNMPYLDMCIKETLRLYPVVPLINRLCSRRYELPCGVIVEPGELLTVPVVGIHVNEEYFPEPYLFKPERFAQDPPPYTYLPFGEGPRICFAMKFVTTELKVGLCKLVQSYNFTPSPGSEGRNLDLAKWTLFMKPSSPVWFRFSHRKNTNRI